MRNVKVIAHWNQLIEGLSQSPKEFYRTLEDAIQKRDVPDAELTTVHLNEGPMLGGKRLYLRVERLHHTIDVCAAPFGSGSFVSWWCARPTRRGLLYLLLFVVPLLLIPVIGVLSVLIVKTLGLLWGSLAVIAGVLAGIGAVGYAISRGFLGIEDDVLELPLLGAIYEWIFNPFSYYRADTEEMFRTAIHASVLEVVDGLTTAKGLRSLSEVERTIVPHAPAKSEAVPVGP